jgi:thiol:disulfide interchange protein DsbA
MNRRTALQQLGALALLAGSAGRVLAQDAKLYEVLEPAVPAETSGKIEILEFFHYGCPHCRTFEPLLTQWKKNLPADVALGRVPAIWGNPELQRYAQLYYALEVAGQADRLSETIFTAIQDEHVPLHKEEAVQAWIGKQGIDAQTFIATYKSFGVQSKVKRADQLARLYKIEGVPTLAVAGRFLTGGSQESLKVVDQLIDRVRTNKG